MISWKVQNRNRLLKEVKNKCSEHYSVKDIRWSIEHNRCSVNQRMERFGSAEVHPGDTITITLEKRPTTSRREEKRVLYEDESLLLYDKPPSLTTEELGQILNCHLVHRLDRDTSGILLLAKTQEVQKNLERQFRERLVHKEYLAIVEGDPGESGRISGKMAMISRREGAVVWGMKAEGVTSSTSWKRLDLKKSCALLHCFPLTGRTHQIRVHLAHIGHPIVGDVTYGSRRSFKNIFRPLLHAYCISFIHPVSGEKVEVGCAPPEDFNEGFGKISGIANL